MPQQELVADDDLPKRAVMTVFCPALRARPTSSCGPSLLPAHYLPDGPRPGSRIKVSYGDVWVTKYVLVRGQRREGSRG